MLDRAEQTIDKNDCHYHKVCLYFLYYIVQAIAKGNVRKGESSYVTLPLLKVYIKTYTLYDRPWLKFDFARFLLYCSSC